MNELIIAVYYSVPFVLAVALAILLVALAGFGLSKPRFLVYPLLILLLTVSGTSYGALDNTARSIYSRGAGVLFFSAFLWAILACLIWVQVANKFRARTALQCNLKPWMLAWLLLLISHLVVGLVSGVLLEDILSSYGFSNILWMSALVLLLLNSFGDESDLDELTKVLIVVALLRALYGLVRWGALGGDPVNAYANRHGLNLKLTFFDINDSLTCMLGMAIASIRLFRAKQAKQSSFWTILCWFTVLASILCIGLSFRRSAWFGLLLAGGFVLIFVSRRQRWQALFLGAPVIMVGLTYAASKRLSQTKGAGGLERLFFEFQNSGVSAVSARQLELTLAWNDFSSNPIFGLGTWGRYSGSALISWQQSESAGAFLHSGVLHIALKAGLVGLLLLAGLYCAFFLFVLRHRHSVKEKHLPLFVAGAAGVLFMLPDMLLGTPIPQVRTMLMSGICFALPYLAVRQMHLSDSMHTQPAGLWQQPGRAV